MTITHRPYARLDDLDKMKALARLGQQVMPHSYLYFANLDWWLVYEAQKLNWAEIITLWEDEGGELVGWQLYNGIEGPYDAIIHPERRGTDLEGQMIDWAEVWLGERLKVANQPIRAFVFADNATQIAQFEARGYNKENGLVLFDYPLAGELPEPELPEGFTLLDRMQSKDIQKRVDLHVGAFTHSQMTVESYLQFTTEATNYDPELDVVVVAPDGTFAAFALCWIDPISKYGEFEPVGTRSDMKRKGLGKAALWEGLRRMQARGMTSASVSTWQDDVGNPEFYQSAGFRPVNRVLRYEKRL